MKVTVRTNKKYCENQTNIRDDAYFNALIGVKACMVSLYYNNKDTSLNDLLKHETAFSRLHYYVKEYFKNRYNTYLNDIKHGAALNSYKTELYIEDCEMSLLEDYISDQDDRVMDRAVDMYYDTMIHFVPDDRYSDAPKIESEYLTTDFLTNIDRALDDIDDIAHTKAMYQFIFDNHKDTETK